MLVQLLHKHYIGNQKQTSFYCGLVTEPGMVSWISITVCVCESAHTRMHMRGCVCEKFMTSEGCCGSGGLVFVSVLCHCASYPFLY